jgi:hypothetical protein
MSWFTRRLGRRNCAAGVFHRPPVARPQVEALEDRQVPTGISFGDNVVPPAAGADFGARSQPASVPSFVRTFAPQVATFLPTLGLVGSAGLGGVLLAPGVPAGAVTVAVNWGDRMPLDTDAVLLPDPAHPGLLTVQGLHAYQSLGTFQIEVTLTFDGASRTFLGPRANVQVTAGNNATLVFALVSLTPPQGAANGPAGSATPSGAGNASSAGGSPQPLPSAQPKSPTVPNFFLLPRHGGDTGNDGGNDPTPAGGTPSPPAEGGSPMPGDEEPPSADGAAAALPQPWSGASPPWTGGESLPECRPAGRAGEGQLTSRADEPPALLSSCNREAISAVAEAVCGQWWSGAVVLALAMPKAAPPGRAADPPRATARRRERATDQDSASGPAE